MAKGTVHLTPNIFRKIKRLDAENDLGIAKITNLLLEKALTKQTVEEKFLETYDFLSEENVEEIVGMIFEGNELAEIVKSKFEVINQK
jgi:hypothetical protein